MQPRALIATLVVLIALFVWTWKLETPGPEEEQDSLTLFPGLEAQNIQEVVLEKGEQVLRLRRSTGSTTDWVLDGPPRRSANDAVAEAAARAVAGLAASRTLDPSSEDSAYGLAGNALHVVAQTDSGEALGFWVGSPLPVSAGSYLRLDGEATVRIVDDKMLYPLQRKTLDFYDLRVFPVAPHDVASLRIRGADGPIVLLRRASNGRFFVESRDGETGLSYRADQSKVQDLLLELGQLKARRFANEIEGHGGTDTPIIEVLATAIDGREARLALGTTDEQEDRYATTSGELIPMAVPGEVLLVRSTVVEQLSRLEFEYRDSSLLDIRVDQVKELSWTVRGVQGQLRKTGTGWLLGQGSSSVHPPTVQLILDDLSELTTTAFNDQSLEEAGVGLEAARIKGKHADGSEFGLSLRNSPTHDYVVIDGEQGRREIDGQLGDLTERLIRLEAEGNDSP